MLLSDIIKAKKLFGDSTGGGTGGGVSIIEEKDVNFYDYDGTLVASYTKAEAQTLTELPAAPDHSGDNIPLTFQYWNAALTHVNGVYSKLNVGAMYRPTDGKTYFEIVLTPDMGKAPTLYFYKNNGNNMHVEWGDGTSSDISTSGAVNVSHTYSNYGAYTIAVSNDSYALGQTNVNNQLAVIGGTGSYRDSLVRCFIGQYVTSIGPAAFYNNRSLKILSIPTNVSSIGEQALLGCCALSFLNIPYSVSVISTLMISECYSLKLIIIHPYLTTINAQILDNTHSFEKMFITESVSSIGTAFRYCYSAFEYHFSRLTPPTLSANAFTGINRRLQIYVPLASLNAYKTATNWAAYANYMVGE